MAQASSTTTANGHTCGASKFHDDGEWSHLDLRGPTTRRDRRRVVNIEAYDEANVGSRLTRPLPWPSRSTSTTRPTTDRSITTPKTRPITQCYREGPTMTPNVGSCQVEADESNLDPGAFAAGLWRAQMLRTCRGERRQRTDLLGSRRGVPRRRPTPSRFGRLSNCRGPHLRVQGRRRLEWNAAGEIENETVRMTDHGRRDPGPISAIEARQPGRGRGGQSMPTTADDEIERSTPAVIDTRASDETGEGSDGEAERRIAAVEAPTPTRCHRREMTDRPPGLGSKTSKS